MQLAPLALHTLVEDCLGLVRPLAQAREIVLRRGGQAHLAPRVQADAKRLRQVLLNLLSNAIKYNRVRGEVLDIQALDDAVLLSVCDTGPCLSAEEQARLFQAFRTPGGSTRRHRGARAWACR